MLRLDMEAQVGKQQLSAARIFAVQLEREITERISALESVARTFSGLKGLEADRVQSMIEAHPDLQLQFNGGLIVHDAEGTAIADFPRTTGRRGVNYIDVDVIAAAVKDGVSSVGRPVMGKRLQRPVVGLAVPISDSSGKVVGALAGVINLGLPNAFDEMMENHYGETGGYFLVSLKDRLIVTATEKDRAMEALPETGVNPVIDKFLEGNEGTVVVIDSRGREVMFSAKNVPVAGWSAVASLPTAEAFQPIREMQRRMLWATALLSVLASALTWLVLSKQLMPLSESARVLAAMSEQDETTQETIRPVRQDEIGLLISSFNRVLEKLRHRESFLHQVFDTSSVAIFLVNREGVIIQANQRMAIMFGMTVEQLIGNEYVVLIHPSEREEGRQRMLALLSSEIPSVDIDRLYLRTDGVLFWGHLAGQRFLDGDGVDLGLLGVIADIDARKRAEEKLQLAASVFSFAREGIMITDPEGCIVDVNDAFTAITGYQRNEVVGRKPRLLKSGRHAADFYATMWRDIAKKGYWLGEIWNRRKSGEIYAEMKTISVIRDAQGQVKNYLALCSDITDAKEHERQLERIAHYDVLTSLPNRVLLADRLHQTMILAQRTRQLLAVVYLDLDGFKAINDAHGHETGDQLLITVSTRMKNALREGDTLARLGGDEFVAVLPGLHDISASAPLLSRMLGAACQSVSIRHLSLSVSASIGVTFYPQTEEIDADQLLRQADQAMYQAKVAGKNRYHVFDAEQDRNVRDYHENLQRIRQGLVANEFELYYQPKVNMRTGRVVGAEALIRWQHPERGLLPPSEFLPIIEDHPLAIELGEWVIDTALRQTETWRSLGKIIPVSVNVSARQLQHPDFSTRLATLLASHPSVCPGDLELEVVETSALEDLPRMSQIMHDCAALGVQFAVDDFGTGYSSLTYLKRLPVSVLKIDQSFVRDMLDDPDDLAILDGVIGLASAFRRVVIAEGVETDVHGKILLQLGCELAQGYGIGRPMPAARMLGWIESWVPNPEWLNVAPMGRDELPLLFAGIEHRAWIMAMALYLEGEQPVSPPTDLHYCRFGQWMDGEGRERYGADPAFVAVDQLHARSHQLAEELCRLKQFHGDGEIAGRMSELYDLRDRLLAQLQLLIQTG